MTTFQDPQPQSRRAVRQGERADGAEPQAGFPAAPAAVPAAPQFFPDGDAQRDMWDTNARRAAQLPATPAPRPDSAATGRRAATSASQPPAAAEPLTYATASRQPATPSYDPQSFRSRLDARQAQQPAPAPTRDDQSYRVRDFSPEGRRAAQAAERAAAAPAWVAPVPAADLDYQTEVREGFGMPATPPAPVTQVPPQYVAPPAPQAAPPAAPLQAAPPAFTPPAPAAAPAFSDAPQAMEPPATHVADAPGEQTLSRRELRAMLAEQDPTAAAQPEALGQTTYNAPVAWQAPAQPAQQAPVPPAPIQQAQAPIQPAQQAPLYEPAPPALLPPLQEPQAWEASRIPEPVLPPVAPQPSTNTAMTNALAEFDALTRSEPSAPAQPTASADDPAGWRPPVGHWSTQVDLEDDDIETTINRRVGSGSTMTHALVLPEIPLGSDIRGPLTSTGEVMLTGSIDLPHSLSSTGSSDRMEHAGIDSLFDLNDHEVISTDSQPVRAIKAVSTHQTGHGVTHTQKPKGTRALTVLLISASSMAVVVAGLLVAAFAFNLF
ncbi:hypothetical protein BH11ACT4_BH11ACT4_10530 [soil metagenome]